MVVTPMLQKGVEVKLPSVVKRDKSKSTGGQITISITYKRGLFVEQTPVTLDKLKEKIEAELALNPYREIYLKGDVRLHYKKVKEVMRICHKAGAKSIALATEVKHST